MEHVKSLKIVRKNALSAIARAQEKWKGDTSFKPYKAGDHVWLEGTHLHTTHPMRKLRPKRYGPFKVLQTVRGVSYQLKLPVHWKIHNVFHAKLLHPYIETEEYGINFQEPPPDLIEGEEEWEVEQILNEWKQGQTQQYLICWKGYSSAHDSWELITGINAPDLIVEFQKRKAGVKQIQKDQQRCRKESNTAHLRSIAMFFPSHPPSSEFICPPSSCTSNEQAAWYVELQHIPFHSDLSPLPNKSPEPLMIPPAGEQEDVGPSVSECASPQNEEVDI